jgi:hypothetical protein
VIRRLLAGVALAVLAACSSGQGTASRPHPHHSPGPSSTVSASPQPSASPAVGVLNPAVTQATIGTTICVRGWTATIRPPASYTNALKIQQIAERHLTDTNPKDYEEDHRLPLELGGAPRDPRNLWPEPWAGSQGARVKDREENSLHRTVCAGRMTLANAQAQILRDWPPQ